MKRLASDAWRLILCVESAPSSWRKPSALRTFIGEHDAKLQRTVFVYTKAHVQLRNLNTYDDALRYFETELPTAGAGASSFFVDTLSYKTREWAADDAANAHVYRLRLLQSQQRLANILRSLHYADPHSLVGLQRLLRRLAEHAVVALEAQRPLVQRRVASLAQTIKIEKNQICKKKEKK